MNSFLQDIENFLGRWGDSSTCITVHTSGTTGEPKPIDLKKTDMRESAKMTGKFLSLSKGDRALLALPLRYIAGKMMVIRAEVLGLKLVPVYPSSVPEIPENMDFAALTPMQIRSILRQHPDALLNIDKLIIGGAPLDENTEIKLLKMGVRAWETYGMTETITHIAMRRLGEPMFEALPGVLLSTDDRDCLVISAPHLGVRELKTNDVVELLDAGAFRWLGRADNVINSGGIKISPESIEKKIANILDGYSFLISSEADPELGERVILLIEKVELDERVRKLLVSEMSEELTKHHRPKKIYTVKEFDRTSTGKIIRRNYIG